jgi:hypothetical protein
MGFREFEKLRSPVAGFPNFHDHASAAPVERSVK